MELQAPGWRRAVDALAQADERHAQRLEVIEQRHQMPEVPAQAVQPPADKHIEPTAPGIPQQGIESRSASL